MKNYNTPPKTSTHCQLTLIEEQSNEDSKSRVKQQNTQTNVRRRPQMCDWNKNLSKRTPSHFNFGHSQIVPSSESSEEENTPLITGTRFKNKVTSQELVFIAVSENGNYILLDENENSIVWLNRNLLIPSNDKYV